MKVSKRTVPMDVLAAKKGAYSIFLGTHREQIEVTVHKDGKLVHSQWFAFEQFVSLLMRDAQP